MLVKQESIDQSPSTKTNSKDYVDLFFLHASPNQYKNLLDSSTDAEDDKSVSISVPALDFCKEKRTIKDCLEASRKAINFKS